MAEGHLQLHCFRKQSEVFQSGLPEKRRLDGLRTYRQIRSITGQKIFVKETRQERADRLILRVEILLAPLVTIFIFALAAGMIRLG